MNIEIKRLSPELIEDYIHFHKHVAFSDNPVWAGCYCVYYHWNDELDRVRKEYEENGGKEFKMNLAAKMIKEDRLRGYLAYVDGEVVGWCNTNEKGNYVKLNKENQPNLWTDYNNESVLSIICFTIAPHMRRKGISSKMLDQIIEDAKTNNYDYLEVYPGTGKPDGRSYHGPHSIYEKRNFIEVESNKEVMRLYLKGVK